MQDLADGKFCDLCNKKVLDLDKISSLEFEELSKDGDKICGKKSLLNQKKIFFSFLSFYINIINIPLRSNNKSISSSKCLSKKHYNKRKSDFKGKKKNNYGKYFTSNIRKIIYRQG